MDYNFVEIEKKWQHFWAENKTFKAENNSEKPKYYVLDMFPYPSGSGLHVGHPLGYIASDIYSRFKRLKGFNVLHPMGFDAYGLPAEQYAIQTGQHPAITTEKNIARYKEQLNKIGFSFDWSREVRTSDPSYYKWTQWTFIQLFNSWYNKKTDKAEPVFVLITEFENSGNSNVQAACNEIEVFTAEQWTQMSEKQQQDVLMHYRLAYLADTMVNWCPALGTVLANDEVSEGVSVRGGHPVVRKEMKQWSLRITAYADRLLNGLNEIDWTDSIKEIQRNWIGKSVGAMIKFPIKGHDDLFMEIFTTRPDTIFGVTYMTFAPEHEYAKKITTSECRDAVENYIEESANRTERERIADVKHISGKFTGAYAINPFTNEEVPIWVGDYVLAGYGTGAVMAVPAHDTRDYAFAKHFNLPIKEVISGGDISVEAYDPKEGIAINSGFITGMQVKDAMSAVIKKAEEMGMGYGKVNFRLRDAIFSRQRYWGEPFPVYYKDGIPCVLEESELPLELPEVDKYLPTETGEPPLARAKNWVNKDGYPLETSTMPGFAGSSAYYLRYMDPPNNKEYFSKSANEYWENVDLYIGGAEHATGHLIYSRFWNKFLYDLGLTCKQEPFKKLINQGMIQGRSSFVWRLVGTNVFVSTNLVLNSEVTEHIRIVKEKLGYMPEQGISFVKSHVDISLVNNDILNIEAFKKWRNDLSDAEFILEDGKYVCDWEVEKMSKSLYNVQNPDDLVEKYGADTLRLYEMFLGPLEQHKPWDINGIEGVFRFMRKLWKLYHDRDNNFTVSDEEPTAAELKILHKTIKKIQEDIERFSFNTAVSSFMICVNELSEVKCNNRKVLESLTVLISPYAPHIAEELWSLLGNTGSISFAEFPEFDGQYLVENSFDYPVSFNGKMRYKLTLPADMPVQEIEKSVLEAPESQKWLEGKPPRKIVVVPNRIINIVL